MQAIQWMIQHPGEIKDAFEFLVVLAITVIGIFKAWQAHDYKKIQDLTIPFLQRALAVAFTNADRRNYVRDQVWGLLPPWTKLLFFSNNPEKFALMVDDLWRQLKPQLQQSGLLNQEGQYQGKEVGELVSGLVEAINSPLNDGDPTPIPPRNPLI